MTSVFAAAGHNGDDRATISGSCIAEDIGSLPSPVSSAGAVGSAVGVVGLGYVGLPTALAFAEAGSAVVGFDVSAQRLTMVEAGAVDLLEADHKRLRRHVGSDRFLLTDEPANLALTDTVIVCVPTPVDDYLVPDMSALSTACAMVARQAVPGQTIILTSTTFVGCTRDFLVKSLHDRGLQVGVDIFVAFSPERIDPGNALHPQETTPRVVGGVTPACGGRAAAVLRSTTTHVAELSSPEAAELTKLVENSFRAVNIALANEFADAAQELGVDVVEVINAAATKPYGFMAFYPGPGVGGHCIPCDPHYLLWQLRAQRADAPVLETAMTAVAARPRRIVARAREVLSDAGRPVAGARILVVGVTYKPGVADLRESPALEIIARLAKAGADISYVDPYVPSLRVGELELVGVTDPAAGTWDLVLVHTVHWEADHGWITGFPAVLDASYRMSSVPHRALL